MQKNSIYKKLYKKLTVTPTGAPKGEKFIEILKILFTPEEAELALILPFMPTLLKDVAAGSKMKEEDVEKTLSKMADKGLVYTFNKSGAPMFLLFSVVWTIFKFPLMTNVPDVDYEKLRSLWNEYLEEGLGGDGTPVPGGKHLPMGRVLPVQENLSMESEVLPQDLVYKHIDEAKHISIGECSCKKTVGACNSPTEVCMALGHEAKFLVERKMARPISKDEARAIHKEAVDAGLVSVTSNTKDRINLICHCCPCCCAQLGVGTRHGLYDLVPKGAYSASVKEDECTACGSCEEVCPMKAIIINDVAEIDIERCIGCGLCISSCPDGALSLIKRTPPPDVPENIMDWTKKAVEKRGITEEFLKELEVKKRKD
jgi:NAD-dependent dihydropyrimidine dehydrogenase PreA subunit